MSSSSNLCIILLLILYQYSQSQLLCYELPSSECYPQNHKKQCIIWNTPFSEQCICLLDPQYPMDVYFLLDTTNIDEYSWDNIIKSIPSSFLSECASPNTNLYIIQYTNNETSILSNPSLSQLLSFQPTQFHGEYSSFCNTLNTVQSHIQSQQSRSLNNHKTPNPILLVLITGSDPHDTNINHKCDYFNEIDDDELKLRDLISDSYGVYLDNIPPFKYEPILGYHQAFQLSVMTDPELTITRDLITATLCETACDIADQAVSIDIDDTILPTIDIYPIPPPQPAPIPIPSALPAPQPNVYMKPWGWSDDTWYKEDRWNGDPKEYNKYKDKDKGKKKKKKRKNKGKKKTKHDYKSGSWSRSDESSNEYKPYGFDAYGWNGRYRHNSNSDSGSSSSGS